MRYPPDRKRKTRARIVTAAGQLFRGRGIAATGVDAVMARAGFTAGGFYAHFPSKASLVREVVEESGAASWARLSAPFADRRGRAWLEGLFQRYLDPAHREDAAHGCIMPSLAAEIARATPATRRQFARRFEGMLALVAERTRGEVALGEDEVIAAVALAVGGVLLSRAVPDRARAKKILRACHTQARKLVGLDDQKAPRVASGRRVRRSHTATAKKSRGKAKARR